MTVRYGHHLWQEAGAGAGGARALKREGWPHKEVTEALAVSQAAVSKWMKQVATQGKAG